MRTFYIIEKRTLPARKWERCSNYHVSETGAKQTMARFVNHHAANKKRQYRIRIVVSNSPLLAMPAASA